jgi:hypothetical protein
MLTKVNLENKSRVNVSPTWPCATCRQNLSRIRFSRIAQCHLSSPAARGCMLRTDLRSCSTPPDTWRGVPEARSPGGLSPGARARRGTKLTVNGGELTMDMRRKTASGYTFPISRI